MQQSEFVIIFVVIFNIAVFSFVLHKSESIENNSIKILGHTGKEGQDSNVFVDIAVVARLLLMYEVLGSLPSIYTFYGAAVGQLRAQSSMNPKVSGLTNVEVSLDKTLKTSSSAISVSAAVQQQFSHGIK